MRPHSTALCSTLALLMAGSLTTPAPAQSASERTLIAVFRDSLDRSVDSVSLARLETRLVRAAGTVLTPGPFDHLKLGFLTLRLGDLGMTRGYEDAASEFASVTRLAPAWPYGWYGLGLAEYSLAVSRGSGPGLAVGLDPARALQRSAEALARAALTDGRFADLVVAEAHFGRRIREPSRSLVALEALRTAGRDPRSGVGVLHALGQVEREYGDPARALSAFESMRMGSERLRGLAQLEIARTRLLLGRGDGQTPYFQGAVHDDSVTVLAYRADLEPIATAADLRGFDQASGAARAEFLRRFWSARDLADFRQPGERLREHYRRLYAARRAYPRYLPVRGDDQRTWIALANAVDDRGLVFLRHGEPDDRASLTTLGLEPNESWRYRRTEGDMVVHFVARRSPDEFQAVESLFDVADVQLSALAGQDEIPVEGGTEMLLRSRESLSPFFQSRASAPDRARAFRVAERVLGRTGMVTALGSDSYRIRWARSLDARLDLALVGKDPRAGTGGEGAVARLAIAIPSVAAGEAWLGDGVTYPVRFRLSALDESGNGVVVIDSTIRPVTVTHAGTRWLASVISVPLPAGRFRLRVALDQGEAGTVFPVIPVAIPAVPTTLAMSDLMLGEPGGPWTLTTPAGKAALHPLATLSRVRPAEVAFLVHGRDGAAITCQITVARTDDDPGVAYSETWTGVLNPAELLRHRLPLDRLAPGLYRIEVTLRDGAGALSRRWKEFQLSP